MKKIFYFKKADLCILVMIIIIIAQVISLIKLIVDNKNTPVEEIQIETVDSITRLNKDIKYKLDNLDSIRNENIKKSLNLDDSTTIELFKWLLAK